MYRWGFTSLISMEEKNQNTVQLPARQNLDGGGFSEESSLAEETKVREEPALSEEEEALFNEMMEVGVFYGRSKSRTNPLMKKYVLATRAGFEVIDLKETMASLKAATGFIKEVMKASNGSVLLVGTSPAAKATVKELARRLDLPAVTERWLGGTLTNFKVISERINQFKKLKADIAAGKFEKYTKKERLEQDRELARLEILFGGIEKLERFPSLILITDLAVNTLAAKEAKRTGIPVVALVNTDADPRLADYVIPANDKNPRSIKLILDYLAKAIEEAKAAKETNG